MDYYLIAVIVLFIVAIGDLIVGVSNDAVNFLNSAIGSRAAKRRTILIVASAGVFVGAAFSGGLMEVARKGIFMPGAFTFEEIMIIFLAVMLTDIVLLDTFNTYGLPTSTTVSIVFELLGAATIVALLKLIGTGGGLASMGTYINGSSAITIIVSIFLSVGIAFVAGLALQYLSRILFTFQYERRLKTLGGIWVGLAMAAMTYFLFVKGLKGATFVDESFTAMVTTNVPYVILGAFALWSLAAYGLMAGGVNILRLVVLFGTFALALAFAGNDLVNFIGVPIAAFQAFTEWHASGLAPDELMMGMLAAEDVKANPWILLGAGAIMATTLWLSRKAQSVTETEVNLGRQDVGAERFTPGPLARGIVRGSRAVGGVTHAFLPASFFRFTDTAFANPVAHDGDDAPAFDLVRAAVNLAVASMLISLATAYKLPLSTTYVSFMVAMGTSLADRAWGRDSAVYRVSGVLTVVGGWFGTAFAAFTAAGLSAILLWTLGGWGLAVLVGLAGLALFRTFFVHRERSARSAADAEIEAATTSAEVHTTTAARAAKLIDDVRAAYVDIIASLAREDRSALKRARRRLDELTRSNERLRLRLPQAFATIEEQEAEGSRLVFDHYDLAHDFLASATLISYGAHNHVRNSMPALSKQQQRDLEEVAASVDSLLARVAESIREDHEAEIEALATARPNSWLGRARERMRTVDASVPPATLRPTGSSGISTELKRSSSAFFARLDEVFSDHVRAAKGKGTGSPRAAELFIRILTESRDLVVVGTRYVSLFRRSRSELGE